MKGYRNVILALVAALTSTALIALGIRAGTDLVGLSAVLAAKDGAIMGMIFGRGYNKRQEALNGGVQ